MFDRRRPGTALTLALIMMGCGTKAVTETEPEPGTVERPARAEAPPEDDTPKDRGEALPPLGDGVLAAVGKLQVTRAQFDALYVPDETKLLARRGDGKVPDAYQASRRKAILTELTWALQLQLEAERSGNDHTPAALTELDAEGQRHIRDWPAWLERVGQTPEIRHAKNIVYLRERALMVAKIGGPLEASEAELKATYEENREKISAPEEVVRASHILVTFGPREPGEKIQPLLPDAREAASAEQKVKWEAAALAQIQELRAAAEVPGVDFNELAREWSEGPGAFRGGDMGIFPRRQMVPEYAEAAFALEAGGLSAPVHSEKGYYLIKVFGHYAEGPLPYEAVVADLVRQVEGQKYKAAKAALKADLDGRFPVQSPALEAVAAWEGKL